MEYLKNVYLCLMKRIYSILIGTQGAFVRLLEKEDNSFFVEPHFEYLSPINDKLNMKADLLNCYADFRKATNKAKIKLGVR